MRNHERAVDLRAAMMLAVDSGCSAYGCEFIAVAESAGVPLITSDRRILQSFPEIAQSIADFIR
jgi:predicted nucleic acid-binding protein